MLANQRSDLAVKDNYITDFKITMIIQTYMSYTQKVGLKQKHKII